MSTSLATNDRNALATLFDTNAPIQKIMQRAEGSISAALRGPVEAPALVRSALLTISMTPALHAIAQTSRGKTSILQCVMQAASLGLMVGGPAGEAAMVPYKGEAKLLPMVRGFVTLAIRSGSVLSVSPRAVFPDDQFEVLLGTVDQIRHVPSLKGRRDDDSQIVAFYTIFKMAGGVTHFDWMTRDEVDAVRARSRAKDEGPWVTDYGEMGKKTTTKRGSKMVPLSPEFRAAVELDNRFETGTINEASDLLDSQQDITAHVMDQTKARTAALRERLARGAKLSDEENEELRQAEMDAEGAT